MDCGWRSNRWICAPAPRRHWPAWWQSSAWCGAARPHHDYLFTNRLANRLKMLVHDGIGVSLAARRLNSGKFVWPKDVGGTLTLSRAQFDAFVLGLRWQRIGEASIITVL